MQPGWGQRRWGRPRGQRISAWLLVPAVLLALGVGTLLGRAVHDDTPAVASGKKTEVLGSVVTRPDTSTTETTGTTAASEPTTTAAPAVAAATTSTTAVQAVATTAPTTAKPATTTTTRRVADDGCGAGSAGAQAQLRITGDGPPNDPFFTYSGQVTVTNNTTKTIEVDTLDVRITSADGTVERVPVQGGHGALIDSGVARDFSFSFTTKHEPKEGGAQMGTFSYRAPGGSAICATT
jgi:hypothetical protein